MMTPDSLDTVVEKALVAIKDCRYDSHDWHQSYLDAYDGKLGYGKSWRDVLQDGDKFILNEYRCLRCHAVGRYQDLPSTVSYEPVIVRVR